MNVAAKLAPTTRRPAVVATAAVGVRKAGLELAAAPAAMDLPRLDTGNQACSDDLRLPPPPRRAPSGAALRRSVSDALKKFETQARTPHHDEDATDAEARLMATCRGLCSFQDQIFDNREQATRRIEARAR